MSLRLDHVIVCLPDLDESVTAFEDDHGVAAVAGGRHEGHGTANRLVPLVDTYIELVAVNDPAEADASPFGSWVSARASTASAADAIAFRTDDLEGVCDRLGLEQIAMSRMTETGDELRWRIAGLDRLVSADMPFFIQWDMNPELHPGRIPVTHPSGETTLSQVIISGDEEELTRWVGDVDQVTIEEGPRRVDFELSATTRG